MTERRQATILALEVSEAQPPGSSLLPVQLRQVLRRARVARDLDRAQLDRQATDLVVETRLGLRFRGRVAGHTREQVIIDGRPGRVAAQARGDLRPLRRTA